MAWRTAKDEGAPINYFMTRNGRIREDGREICDMYLIQAKPPDETKGLGPGEDRRDDPRRSGPSPAPRGGCPLVKK